jgi:hypothetical protein
MIKALKYKLSMFGIEIMEEETKVFGDNNTGVIINTSGPESTLKKKHHHSINYKYVREAVAAGFVQMYKVDTGSNLADLFTNSVNNVTRKEIIQ